MKFVHVICLQNDIASIKPEQYFMITLAIYFVVNFVLWLYDQKFGHNLKTEQSFALAALYKIASSSQPAAVFYIFYRKIQIIHFSFDIFETHEHLFLFAAIAIFVIMFLYWTTKTLLFFIICSPKNNDWPHLACSGRSKVMEYFSPSTMNNTLWQYLCTL